MNLFRHLLVALLVGLHRDRPVLRHRLVAEETLDAVDAEGLVVLGAVAGLFAGMGADAPAGRRKGLCLGEDLPGFLVGLLE